MEEEFAFSRMCNDRKLMDKYVAGSIDIGQDGALWLVYRDLQERLVYIEESFRGYTEHIGCVDSNKNLPVYIQMSYVPVYMKGSVKKYIVLWYFSGRYADYNLSEEYFKKKYPDCEHTDINNMYRLNFQFKVTS